MATLQLRITRGLAIMVFAIIPVPGAFAVVPSFQGIGILPGADGSHVSAISGDGSTVVGGVETDSGSIAVRWTRDGGIVALGQLPGGLDHSGTSDVSYDGSVIIGHSYVPSAEGSSNWQATLWNAAEGVFGLGYLGVDGRRTIAASVSGDGTSIVGYGDTSAGFRAFEWSSGSGMTELGIPDGGVGSFAHGISDSGRVIVGSSPLPHTQVQAETVAFRYTQEDGFVDLGSLGGPYRSTRALDISADEAVIIGNSRSPEGLEAFRWTESSGMIGLGDLPGGAFYSSANAVSANGSTIVGYSTVGIDEGAAFIWTAQFGMQSLADMLTQELGLNLTGWSLIEANGISADGLTIVGSGINPNGDYEGWVVTLPEPSSITILGISILLLRNVRRRQ